ncbi:MAG: hypothetical protein Q9183_004392, partial [Haloplaca sp. 2 TL-2023]
MLLQSLFTLLSCSSSVTTALVTRAGIGGDAVSITSGSGSDTDGNVQEYDEVCKDYQECLTKGHGLWTLLLSNLSSITPYVRPDTSNLFYNHYAYEHQHFDLNADLVDDFIRNRLNADHLDLWILTSENPKTGAISRDVAYMNVFDTNQGIIIADNNWRDVDEQKTLPWSELMYETWQLAWEEADRQHELDPSNPPGGSLSKITCVIQHIVANYASKRVLAAMYRAAGYSIAQGDEQWYRWTESKSPYDFYALLATDNVKGTLWLLNDHSVETGKKTIREIWTRWPEESPDI